MKKQNVSPPEPGPERTTTPVTMSEVTGKPRHQLLPPTLASTAVLLAMIGLSQEFMMVGAPDFFTDPGRQWAVGRKNGPATAQPGFIDGLSYTESRIVADVPLAAGYDRSNESSDRRSEDTDGLKARPASAAGKELDQTYGDGLRDTIAQAEGRQPRVRSKVDLAERDESGVLAEPESVRLAEEILPGRKAAKPDSSLHKINGPETGYSAQEASAIPAADGAAERSGGFDFLAHYQQMDGLSFQPAQGYWANSYIPGDPQIRLLSARLAQHDRSWLGGDTGLERVVVPVSQPFDSPDNNALALSLMADTNAIPGAGDGATRMRLQVGIRAIEHRRGQRPAMNVGVVLDLPADAPDEVRIASRALLDALLQSQQAGDNFSLVTTGSGLVVEAKDFRFGSLQLAKQQILNPRAQLEASGPTAPRLDLLSAMQRAAEMVQQTDDPSRPLGSSSVLLISADRLADLEQLAGLAHAQAKEGITLSVVPLGDQPQSEAVDQLVLAGLGHRRYLEKPGLARQLIEEELHASSRAVARAARLSVRLAPGVRLIGVVGSERLDLQRARRVREIEHSMDQRLSNNLGIQADRGADEDGIQIVIPSIFSGDSMTVLLDVVTDRPGAIAEVSLRYKDLVFLRNGSLQSQLGLPAGSIERGPAELSVLKNLLSHHFVEAVEQAAAALGRQQPAAAIAVLSAMHSTIEQSRRQFPTWVNNPDLMRDQQILERYLAALGSPRAVSHQSFLTDSLLYAAWAKTHRPLKEWK